MIVLIVGASGNMGTRYARILDFLDVKYVGADEKTDPDELIKMASRAQGVIIATPTDTHLPLIQSLSKFKRPLLCEKPLSKDVVKLRETLEQVERDHTPLNMVFQYSVLSTSRAIGWSYYNYFKHGSDGLAWDCIQIIGLARGQVDLGDDSPVWRCRINGQSLSLAHMDSAYIKFIQNWLRAPGQSLTQILDIHQRTDEVDRSGRNART